MLLFMSLLHKWKVKCTNIWVAPLRIAPFPESGQVLEGERMTLVCTLSSGEPANIKWEFRPLKQQAWNKISTTKMAQFDEILSNSSSSNNGPLYSVLKTDPFTSLLSIGKVEWGNMGKYICEAWSGTDDSRNVFRSYDLTVLGMKLIRWRTTTHCVI